MSDSTNPKASSEVCTSCRSPISETTKGIQKCGVCEEFACKKCVRFLEESTFQFYKKIPADLSHTFYCTDCYDQIIEPALVTYNELIEVARTSYFFFQGTKRPPKLEKRSKTTVTIEHSVDREDTILGLAFQAAELGFNAVVDAVVTGTKVRTNGYQKSDWRGTGTPALVNRARMEREDLLDP